jgi:GAF domain-containing protein
VRHVRLLSETIAAVTASLDLAEVTANVARAVARALEADACFVYAYDRPADELVLQAVYGTRLDEAAPLPRINYRIAERTPQTNAVVNWKQSPGNNG